MKHPKFIAHDEMVRAIGPVTKRELDALRDSRETAAPVLELTPGGATERIIHKFEAERRAVREGYIENRLDRMEGRASNDFALARVHGKAKRDFDRER
ncbi:MAG: hypothetical protein WDO68_22230 [Gammaproteobacteria bacterium]